MQRTICSLRLPSSFFTQSGSASRSEEHTSELQSLMRISYAVFCLKKKNITNTNKTKLKYKETNQPILVAIILNQNTIANSKQHKQNATAHVLYDSNNN